jgi:hypothetical protein
MNEKVSPSYRRDVSIESICDADDAGQVEFIQKRLCELAVENNGAEIGSKSEVDDGTAVCMRAYGFVNSKNAADFVRVAFYEGLAFAVYDCDMTDELPRDKLRLL